MESRCSSLQLLPISFSQGFFFPVQTNSCVHISLSVCFQQNPKNMDLQLCLSKYHSRTSSSLRKGQRRLGQTLNPVQIADFSAFTKAWVCLPLLPSTIHSFLSQSRCLASSAGPCLLAVNTFAVSQSPSLHCTWKDKCFSPLVPSIKLLCSCLSQQKKLQVKMVRGMSVGVQQSSLHPQKRHHSRHNCNMSAQFHLGWVLCYTFSQPCNQCDKMSVSLS